MRHKHKAAHVAIRKEDMGKTLGQSGRIMRSEPGFSAPAKRSDPAFLSRGKYSEFLRVLSSTHAPSNFRNYYSIDRRLVKQKVRKLSRLRPESWLFRNEFPLWADYGDCVQAGAGLARVGIGAKGIEQSALAESKTAMSEKGDAKCSTVESKNEPDLAEIAPLRVLRMQVRLFDNLAVIQVQTPRAKLQK
jgi:hypothetical protein